VLVAWLLVRHRGWKTSEVVATVGLVGTTCGWVGTFLERRLEARTARLDAKPTAPSLAAEQLDVWRQWLRATVLAARVEQGSQLDQMVSRDKGMRLVVLGEPGYGKTVAALTLIAHVNAREQGAWTVAVDPRLTDAYEFRHRELLEHLASPGGSSR